MNAILDIDSHGGFVNLALMKIARWHKDKGEPIEWAMPLFGNYDTIYASKIFTNLGAGKPTGFSRGMKATCLSLCRFFLFFDVPPHGFF